MTDEEITGLFVPLRRALDDDFRWLINNRPLLAHYTSMDAAAKILQDEQIWFSNPLFMNDLEEMRFGMLEGKKLFLEGRSLINLSRSAPRFEKLKEAFEFYFNRFEQEHALDVYVFCLSQHDPENTDGLLSMWRGYGAHGNGAALVFNTGFVTMKDNSPLVITKVSYASREHRLLWLKEKIDEWVKVIEASIYNDGRGWAKIWSSTVPDEKLYLLAYEFFNLIKLFALRYKHDGFAEEREWRIIYFPDHDPHGLLKESFGYTIGSRGVEPKLKFKIKPLPIEPHETWTFATILERVILGPSVSSPLARSSVMRMLETMGKPELGNKVVSSSIPLRPI